ncbi:MAG: FprA family A-type flavoprotein [Clostridiales bacterium]|nr:FprA family A-type flavoprotein [Clostridiales bacterium]
MQSIKDNIKYIGVDDDNIDLFEGQYAVVNGISYNSYIIEDEKTAIVDSVDKRLCDEWLDKIALTLDGRCPDYIIVNHVEPDHSGSLRALMVAYPDVKVVATSKAIAMLGNFFEDIDFHGRAMAVKDDETLSLGNTTLRFLTAPMVHWPEVMVTLDETDGVLFSADAFGSFATSASGDAWDSEARRYYCNIVGKYGNSVQSVMRKLAGRKFSVVAPLHGPVLSNNLSHYWQLYDKWSRWEPECRGTLIAYASVYGGTARAARLLDSMLESLGESEVVLMDLSRHDVSYAVAEAFKYDKLVLCSITYDGMLFPAMYNFLHHLQMKGFKGRTVGLVENGSWVPAAARLMSDTLGAMKDMTVVEPVVTLHGSLHASDSETLHRLAENLHASR